MGPGVIYGTTIYMCWLLMTATFETYHQETRLVQIFMALRPEYEHVTSMLLHWSPVPMVDIALYELISKEQSQSSLATKRTVEVDRVLVSASLTSEPELLGPLSRPKTQVPEEGCLSSRELNFSAFMRLGQDKLSNGIFINHQIKDI